MQIDDPIEVRVKLPHQLVADRRFHDAIAKIVGEDVLRRARKLMAEKNAEVDNG